MKTTRPAFSFFLARRYQSCSRAARISFLHNIRGHSRFYAFVVGNISKRSIRRLNNVWAIRYDIVISGFRKAFRRARSGDRFESRVKANRNLSFPHVLKAIGMLNNYLTHSFSLFMQKYF